MNYFVLSEKNPFCILSKIKSSRDNINPHAKINNQDKEQKILIRSIILLKAKLLSSLLVNLAGTFCGSFKNVHIYLKKCYPHILSND